MSPGWLCALRCLLAWTLLTWALVGCGGGGGSATGEGGGSVVTPPVVVTPPTPGAPYPAGLSSATLVVGGLTREYRVHVPPSVTTAPSAVVLVLHGGGGAGLDVANLGMHPLSVFRTVADREGFIVVYPGGMPAADGSPGWNDCRSDNLVGSSADDLAFLDALIDRLRSQYALPASRVFMAGGSNGAQMTLAYAVTRAPRVAAVASSGGSLPLNPKPGECSAPPARPLPILLAHGSADTQMPYGGGCVANVGGGCSRGRVVSAEATRDQWLAANGSAGAAPVQTVVDLDKADAGAANRFQYAGAAPLEWWRLDGAGHTVPSRAVLVAPNDLTGTQNRDVEFAEIAWAFFRSTFEAAASSPPSAQALQAAREYNFASGGQTHLVMHEGRVLDEAYANGGAADRVQLLASATKGFTGMVGAIAASDGLFDLDEPVAQRALVEWQGDTAKSKITYRHLLTMSSGLQELNDLSGWLDYLRAPVLHPAGSTFVYSGDPNIFGLALERRLGGETVQAYFERRLFAPLGMTSVRWGTNFADGRPQLSGGAYVTARDWAKFGEFIRLTMSGGWTGQALLSRLHFDQVFASSAAHPAYGFYWWLKKPVAADLAQLIDANNKNQYSREIKPIFDDPRIPADMVMAAGAYDQRLYVIASRGLTVVRNGPTGTNAFEDAAFLGRLLGTP